MATPAQILANQSNAALSTGPTSTTGKLTSSRNAQSHGLTTRQALLPSEDPKDYQDHRQAYTDRYRPQSLISHEIVHELADLRWRLRRVSAFEAQLLNGEYLKLTTDPALQPLIKHLTHDSQILALAFSRLVTTGVLNSLLHQEARLSRRADKIQARLEQGRQFQPPAPALVENRKIEPNPPTPQPVRVTPQPGRNEPCPCNSGLKFKRCCLNKPTAAAA